VTDTLPKLTALSEEYLWSTLVVEQTVSGASMLCFGVRGLGDVLPTPRPRRTPICSTPSCRSAPASAARLYGLWSARRGTEVIVALGSDAVVGAELVTG
jgi:hypothetical protein